MDERLLEAPPQQHRRVSIQAPPGSGERPPAVSNLELQGDEAEENERLVAQWRARGIHTPCIKQAVWEILSSRVLKDADLARAGFPNVTVQVEAKAPVATPIARLRRLSTRQPGRMLAPSGRILGRVFKWTAPVNRIVETGILLLIIANVVAVVIDAITDKRDISASDGGDEERDARNDEEYEVFEYLELTSTVVFTIEYVMRVWSCTAHPRFAGQSTGRKGACCNWFTGRLRFMQQPLTALDLAALIPFYLDIFLESGFRLFGNKHQFRGGLLLRVLRLLRVFSLLRLERQLAALQILARVFKSRSNELLVTAYALCTLTLLGGVLGYYLEAGSKDPKKTITTLAESLYWCVVTITTVGYGDLSPVTTAGKGLSMVLSLVGVLMFALPAGILGSGFVEVMQQHLQDEEEEQSKQIHHLTELVLDLAAQSKNNQKMLEERLAAIEAKVS